MSCWDEFEISLRFGLEGIVALNDMLAGQLSLVIDLALNLQRLSWLVVCIHFLDGIKERMNHDNEVIYFSYLFRCFCVLI